MPVGTPPRSTPGFTCRRQPVPQPFHQQSLCILLLFCYLYEMSQSKPSFFTAALTYKLQILCDVALPDSEEAVVG